MKEGHMVGLRRMFGYNIEHGVITVNPTEAAIVKSIFEQYISGGSTVGIREHPYERKVQRSGPTAKEIHGRFPLKEDEDQ